MTEAIAELDFNRHVQDLRETWQGRALRATHGSFNWPGRTNMGAVILSVLAHNFDDAFFVLLKAVFPDIGGIRAPFICSAAKIRSEEHTSADVVLSHAA